MMLKCLESIDYVQPSLPIEPGFAKLQALLDDVTIIRMAVKQRLLMMWHAGVTHRVDLDWLKRVDLKGPGIFRQRFPRRAD